MNCKSVGLALVVLLAGCVAAQQKPSSSAEGGIISGRAFAITKGGDLKPARMIDVVIFYGSTTEGVLEPDSAAQTWVNIKQTKMDDYNSKPRLRSENLECHRRMIAYTNAYVHVLLVTGLWATTNPDKYWQTASAKTDEEGNFRIAVSHPGRYTVLATGQAGAAQAFWETENVVVKPGETTTVKLSQPEEACLPIGY